MKLNPIWYQRRILSHLGEIDSPLARVRTGTLACLGMHGWLISESTRGYRRRTDAGSVPSATEKGDDS